MRINTETIPRDLMFNNEGRAKLLSGINVLADAVKSTLGPSGQTVIVESPNHVEGMMVTKDGVSVANEVNLPDPVENVAVMVAKAAAKETANTAGDGTTTSIVLMQSLVNEGIKMLEGDPNKTKVLRKLNALTLEVVEDIRRLAIKTNPEIVKNVAVTSANNDEPIGEMIADLYNSLGDDAVVLADKSKTDKTYSKVIDGIILDKGFSTPEYINMHDEDRCVLENPLVLVTDITIEKALQIEHLIGYAVSVGRPILIIGNVDTHVDGTLVQNIKRGAFKACVVPPPDFGYRQYELMDDLAVALGTTFFSERSGDNMATIKEHHLGEAARVVVGRNETVITQSKDDDVIGAIEKRVSELKVQLEATSDLKAKEHLKKRIANLKGSVGVIYVWGQTKLEMSELYDRVDDSIQAVKSAISEGVLPGGGLALYHIGSSLEDSDDPDEMKAIQIMKKALSTPITQILHNAGLTFEDIYGKGEFIFGNGYNLNTGKYGDMISMGIVDPAKVTKSALKNAVSVATTILSTNAIITMQREVK